MLCAKLTSKLLSSHCHGVLVSLRHVPLGIHKSTIVSPHSNCVARIVDWAAGFICTFCLTLADVKVWFIERHMKAFIFKALSTVLYFLGNRNRIRRTTHAPCAHTSKVRKIDAADVVIKRAFVVIGRSVLVGTVATAVLLYITPL
jgi:hypothetical protein